MDMNKIIQSLVQTIPKNLSGSYLVKTTEVFVPYKEIGIECLTREITEINLFFESILKFIDIGVQDIDEVAHILGVDYAIIKEVVVDMIEQKYLVTTENKIIMTPRGRRALETRKLVTIQKRFINQVLVNLITGEIVSGDGIFTTRVEKNDICLNEELVVDKAYLENHHNTINEIFQKYQVEDNVFGRHSITRELYKILDLAYEKLVYIKNQLYVYKNFDAEEYQFAFKKDINEQYVNCFYRQVKDVVPPSLENFFERDYSFASSHSKNVPLDNILLEKTQLLCKLLNDSGDVIQKSIEEQFKNKRYMLTDDEYRNFFLHGSEFIWDKLIIVSGRLKKLFDNRIWGEIRNLSRNKEIYIVFDEKEYGIENELDKLKSNSVKRQNIILIKRNGLSQNNICFFPAVSIGIDEEVYEMFKRPVTLRKGIIEFEKESIEETVNQIQTDFNIIFNNENKDKNDTRDQKINRKFSKRSYQKK